MATTQHRPHSAFTGAPYGTLDGKTATIAAAAAASVVTEGLSWRAMVQRAWGKDYTRPERAYEFTNRNFDDGNGPYG